MVLFIKRFVGFCCWICLFLFYEYWQFIGLRNFEEGGPEFSEQIGNGIWKEDRHVLGQSLNI